jgi:hypothetical protein
MEPLISRQKFLSSLPKLKVVMLDLENQRLYLTLDKTFSITHPRARKVSLQMEAIVKKNHSITKCHLTSFTQTKTSNNSSRESSKWSNLCFTVTMHQKWHKWKDQPSTHQQTTSNPGLDLDFMTQIKPLKRIELITLIRSTKRLRVFYNAWMKTKRLVFPQNMMFQKGRDSKVALRLNNNQNLIADKMLRPL